MRSHDSKQIRRAAWISAIAASLLGLIFLVYGRFGYDDGSVPWGFFLRLSYDLPFAFTPTRHPVEATIVYMDDESHAALKAPLFEPWDRTNHAHLVNALKNAGAKAVVFDLLFHEQQTNDADFAKAARSFGHVIVGASCAPVQGTPTIIEPRLPNETIRAAVSWGIAEAPVVDGIVRRTYPTDPHATNLVSLAWKAVEVVQPSALPNIFTERWMNFYGPPGAISWLSYVQVLQTNPPLAALSNKVVFVGAGHVKTGTTGGGKGLDEVMVPHTRWTGLKSPGVEINATEYLNLIHHDWLTELAPAYEFLLVLGSGLLFGVILPRLRPLPMVIVGVLAGIVVFACACATLRLQHVWFHWAIISFLQIPTAALLAILLRSHGAPQRDRALGPAFAAELLRHATRPSSLTPQRMEDNSPNARIRSGPNPVDGAVPAVADCTLLRRIGAGAFGDVWIGTTVLGAYRAVKIVYRRNFDEDHHYEREFDGIKCFDPISRNHPGLVHLLHVGRDDTQGHFHYFMELADDVSGSQPFDPVQYAPKTLSSAFGRNGKLTLDECIALGLALTDALGYLHDCGLIHRDIKPSNIIFVDGRPKLADIGLVTPIGEGKTLIFTPGYCPPERACSPAGDLYSLGKVLYEAYTGFHRDHFPDLPTGIMPAADARRSRAFNKIVLKACESDPKQRYGSAQEMLADLQRLASPKKRFAEFFT